MYWEVWIAHRRDFLSFAMHLAYQADGIGEDTVRCIAVLVAENFG